MEEKNKKEDPRAEAEQLTSSEIAQPADGVPTAKTITDLENRLAELERERDEYLHGWKRAKADFINYQKDEARRAEEIFKFSNERLLRDLISVMDSFDLALSAVKPGDSQSEKGIVLIRSQLESLLRQNGLEPIPSVERSFDPALHEAISEEDSDKPPGTVLEEISRGWRIGGKVIRPARVKVARHK